VLDEVNEFVWPGVDLCPIARTKPGVWSFGVLPIELFAEIQTKLKLIARQRRILRGC
jgi:hypothetical protein